MEIGSPRAPRPGSDPGTDYERLAPYLPRFVIDWLAAAPASPHLEIDGSLVLVDVSGFTRLAERLARQGRIGAELLAEVIDTRFSELLSVAYRYGGSLLKFGGDALLLLFHGTAHEARAARAAVGMRSALRAAAAVRVPGPTPALRMSIGIHSGTLDTFLVGALHRELVITGPSSTMVVDMESRAGPGQIVVSPGTAAALSSGSVGAALGAGFLLRRAPAEGPDLPATDPVVLPPVDLGVGLPAALRARVREGGGDPEHRSVTVAFVRFAGTDELIGSAGPDLVSDELDVLVTTVQRACAEHGVAFLATDVDRDGGKFILTAGAPTASGDDETAMLRSLREITGAPRRIALQAGVARGSVFAGDVGPAYRRTFTVMGDAVNLAARLMARAAAGTILAAPEVLARSRIAFETTEVEPFFVKGKSRPVRALLLGAPGLHRHADSGLALPLVGRAEELSRLEEAAARAALGRGSLVEISGEPGIGKSRLVAELCQRAAGLRLLRTSCDSYESAVPYLAFGRMLRDLLGLDGDADSAGGGAGTPAARFLESLERVAPDLVDWAPLIGAVVGVPVAETAATAHLEERFRRSRLVESTLELFVRLVGGPTLIVVEDAQWMDEGSSELLGAVGAAAPSRPWLVCATRNEMAGGFTLADGAGVRIELGPLERHEALALARVASAAPLPAHVATALAGRSSGNPLFLQALLAAGPPTGELQVLPDSIEAVIAVRIDRLASPDRALLRRCSVLGRGFPLALVPLVVEDPPAPGDPAWGRLAGFVTVVDDTVSFEHALVRETAYGGLSYRLRRELHGRIADALLGRARAGDEPAGVLSLHFLRAERYREAWEFAVVAAGRAESVWADVEAVELYERALDAARHIEPRPAEMFGVTEALGDARWRLGLFAAARLAFRGARRAVPGDDLAQARLMLKLARVQGMLDRYAASLSWITRALQRLDGIDTAAARRQRAQLLAWYGRFCQEQGRHDDAIAWCRRAAEAAEAVGEADALAHALRILDWARMDLGGLDEPENLLRSLALYEQLDDLPNQAGVLNMLGGIAYWKGRWTEALDYYERARAAVQRTGNDYMAAFCANNIGEIALNRGHLDLADELFHEARRTWEAAEYRSGIAVAGCNIARVLAEREHFDDARQLLGEVIEQLHAIGARSEELEARARLAECLLLADEAGEALRVADAALVVARGLGGEGAQSAVLHRVRGMALAHSGELDAARGALARSLASARARGADYEIALTLLHVGALHVLAGEPVSGALRSEPRAILARLGVVRPVGAPSTTLGRRDATKGHASALAT